MSEPRIIRVIRVRGRPPRLSAPTFDRREVGHHLTAAKAVRASLDGFVRYLASRAVMDSVLQPYELGSTQWYVLYVLVNDGPTTTDSADQRRRVLRVTDAGRGLWERLPDLEVRQRAKADPRVSVLTQLPGVGPFTALVLLAEIGDTVAAPASSSTRRLSALLVGSMIRARTRWRKTSSPPAAALRRAISDGRAGKAHAAWTRG